jgi:hypothetical protein
LRYTDFDADAAVFVFGTDALELALIEQDVRARDAVEDAALARAEVLADRHRGPRLRDERSGWRPVFL